MKYTREENTLKVTHKGIDYYYIAEHRPSNCKIFTDNVLDAVIVRNIKSNNLNMVKGTGYILSSKDTVITDVNKEELDKTLTLVTLIKTIEIKK